MQHIATSRQENSFYARLYQRYAPGIFAYIYQQTGSREDAEDIVLEVFLAVLQQGKFSTFDEKKQEAWLWTIARNKAVDLHRRSAREQRTSIDYLADTLYEDEAKAPEHISLKREEYAQLHTTIKALSTQQQTVLQLHFGHGLKCAEIAPVLNKSEGAVRMLLFRTIRGLRAIYQKTREKAGHDERA
ncbi:sigma-70 family RNA polymerase sigma factor [Ktedonosporobacter rubrisoli]|uniref:Sigma-70 family RNA polymerase sigma factor n=1 Tax=Ktedonosporobacter rubrisoli TaxID=2509675 RepID=A0A4P6JX08_KTERU|nr:sigma-70 family RNA polymerase sigma factor [Ktedonosporobacter rubrisoli]QBD79900.1 sigma-70 family RNA polymerase sigma factor [Ktedonosporobacter rubrisoli]